MRTLNLLIVAFLTVGACYGQTKIYPMRPPESDTVARNRVYHPEPILFIHGINANDKNWGEAVFGAFIDGFDRYDLPPNAYDQLGQKEGMNTYQQRYLHTFNYGDYPAHWYGINEQSFDHIEYNVLEEDKKYRTFLPSWGNTITSPHGIWDPRKVLETRIQEISQAYQVTGSPMPNIVLVAHSMGGVLSHYYMISRPTTHSVRRLVTLSTPHLGSNYANWLMWYKNTGGTGRDLVRFFVLRQGWSKGVVPARLVGQVLPQTKNLYHLARNGAVEDISAIRTSGDARLRHVNELLTTFWNTPAPKIEYVFNTFKMGFGDLYYATRVASWESALDPEELRGDSVVSTRSAAGKVWNDTPSVWNGLNNPNGTHDIDPVIFGVWPDNNHSDAAENTNAIQ